MFKKILMALLIAAASFNFTATSEAAEYDTENYCCENYYDNDCCDYPQNYHHNYHGGRGCCR